LATDGLFAFSLLGTPDSTSFSSVGLTTINPVFDFNIDDSTTSLIDWEANVFLNSVPVGTEIHLGDIELSGTAAGSTIYTVADAQPGSTTAEANWLSGTSAELDELIFGPGSTNSFQFALNTTAVPEPATFAVICSLGIGVSLRRRRKS
jgi:hypothetical protein